MQNAVLIFLGLIIGAAFFEINADILFKRWSINNSLAILAIGFLLYAIGSILWAFSLKYEPLSKAIEIFLIVNLTIDVLVGLYIFKEHLSTLNTLGILLGGISIVLLLV